MQRSLDVVQLINELFGEMTFPPHPESAIVKFQAQLPPSPVSIIQSIEAGLETAQSSLDQVAQIFYMGGQANMMTLQTLTRAALLGAGRVVFILGANTIEDRRANATSVLQQESKSFLRAIRSFHGFRHLTAFRPTTEAVDELQRQHESLRSNCGDGGSETQTLREMAQLIASKVANHPELETEPGALSEAIQLIWHTYSGSVHGFGWPKPIERDFVADFGIVVSIAHFAFDVASHYYEAD